jgi:hypothetical protein
VFVGICIEEATHWKSTIGIWRLKTFKKHFILKFLILPVKKRLILSHPFKVLLFCEYGKEKWPWNQHLINGYQGEKRGESQIAAFVSSVIICSTKFHIALHCLFDAQIWRAKIHLLDFIDHDPTGYCSSLPITQSTRKGASPEFKTGPQLLPQVGGSMVLLKLPIGGLLWVLYLTDKYLSLKTTRILHVLLKSLGPNYDYFVGIRSFPLLRSSCKDTPHPTTHDLCIFSS